MAAGRKVLLLNASEEIISVISWRRACVLFLQGKARRPSSHEEEYEIPTVGGVFRLPTVLVLMEYVHLPYKKLSVNKENVLRRDNHECQYCNRQLTTSSGTIDHILPTSRGGRHDWTNVVASCSRCNNRKGSRTPQEANMPLRRKPFVPNRYLVVVTAIDLESRRSWRRWIEIYETQDVG